MPCIRHVSLPTLCTALLISAVACQDSSVTGLASSDETPVARKGLVQGPGLRGRIAFASDRAGQFDLYEVDLDSRGIRQLTDDPAADMVPFSWNGGKDLLFSSFRDGDWEIYSMESRTGAIVQITSNPASDGEPILFPPRGKSTRLGDVIAFHSNRNDPGFDIYLLDVSTAFVKRLTNDPARDIDPAISPDGRSVVFTSNRSGNDDLWMIDIEDGNLTQLTTSGAGDGGAAWSPSGRQIAFWRGGFLDIYILSPDDGTETRIELSDTQLYPAWSPNGNYIAFSHQNPDTRTYDIYAVHVASGAIVQITDDLGNELFPSWSK